MAPSFGSMFGFSVGTYNAVNDISEASGHKKLPGSDFTGNVDAAMNGFELGDDLIKISKISKGAPNPLNILGLATFILDKTAFKNDDAGASRDKPNDKKSTGGGNKSKGKSSGTRSPYGL